jgi:hypothetical protein
MLWMFQVLFRACIARDEAMPGSVRTNKAPYDYGFLLLIGIKRQTPAGQDKSFPQNNTVTLS